MTRTSKCVLTISVIALCAITLNACDPVDTVQSDSSPSLSSLSLTTSDGSAIALSPSFASGTTSYAASVDYGVTSVTVAATTSTSGATASGTGTYSLDVGSSTINVVVTAQDGTTKVTYAIAVTRSPSTEARLSALSLKTSEGSAIALSPSFASGTTSYAASVDYGVTSVTVAATTSTSGATASGTGAYSLAVGSTTINVVVTALDGTTKTTYAIAVARDSYLAGVGATVNVNTTDATITFSGTLTLTTSGSLAVSVIQAFSSYAWYIDNGATSAGSGQSITLDGPSLSAGTHHLMLVATDAGGVSYSGSTTFTVTN
jgi:hypothetical protein